MDADKLNLLGHNYMTQGQIDKAFECFQKAIEANPLLPQSYYNLGVCYLTRGEYNLAIQSYKKALNLSPNNTIILNNIGVTYDKIGQVKTAQTFYRKALKTDSTNILSLSNIGAYFIDTNPLKAKKYLQKAFDINPNIADVCYNLGVCLANLGDPRSINYFEKALKLNPGDVPTWGLLCHQLRTVCDWEKAARIEKTMRKIDKANLKCGRLPAQSVFGSAHYDDNLKNNYQIARIWAKYLERKINDKPNFAPSTSLRASQGTVRIGYLSNDFYNHATAQLLIGVLRCHNRKKFAIFAYSYGPDDKSFYRREIEKITKFRDIRELSAADTAKLIYQDKIDILVDLKGQTQGSRLEIAAMRPAPIQVSWLGFPGTTGADFFDYLITDKIITLKSHLPFYREKPIFLPHTYQPTNNGQEIAFGLARKNLNLPEKGFLFCSFNQAYKIDPKTFASWMRILRSVPGSYLCLLFKNKLQVKNLINQARIWKIDPGQIIFCPSLAKNKHLARLSLCDLALDTFVCNGHTTTSDCLWAGVPVVALLGHHFASRVSASLLTAIGLPRLITHSPKEYEKLAISLATDPKKLLSIHSTLNANRLTYPLFDTQKFTQDLESAYSKIWQRAKKGLEPQAIYIDSPIKKTALSMSQNNLGVRFLEQRDFKNAVKCFVKAIRLNKENALAFNNLGTASKEMGNSKLAVKNWLEAIKINPKFEEALSNLGVFYLDNANLEKAKNYFNQVIKIDPKNSTAFNNLGVAYLDQGNLPRSAKYFEKAIKINPEDFKPNYHLGLIFDLIGNVEESAKYFENALRIYPNLGYALSAYLNLLMQVCDWKKLKEIQNRMDFLTLEEIEKSLPISESPFVNISAHQNPKLNLVVARSKSLEIKNKTAGLIPPFSYPENKKHKRIRIGYLSRDFYDHATAYLILGLFEAHDRKNFEIYAYSYGPNDKSRYRKKLEKDADHFTDIAKISFAQAAKIINRNQIDILVDLKGHTRENKLEIAALRPSPIAVSWLGFPGTTGADFIDYLLTDKIVTPPDMAKYYSEKFAYLPNCYQINDNKREIAGVNYKREDFNLPENAFVFSSFNHTTKINPETFSSWMRILKKVPNSVLWLLKSNSSAETNLRNEAHKAGVNPESRLVFAAYLANDNHLARLKLSDLALDTFIYNGHTTTSDCLWVGVPVITLQGKHFASRVASSILTAAGLPQLITHSPKEYEELAISLAKNPKKLQSLRKSLIMNRKSCVLFDTQKFVKNLEKAYTKMWQNYLAGEKPTQIEIK